MQIHYEIYQIQESKNTDKKPIRLFEELNDDVKLVNLKNENYKKVFEGELEPNIKNSRRKVNPKLALEYLFEVFNLNHPKEFKGRSLSVSDIVRIKDKYYHCQSIGWKEIEVV